MSCLLSERATIFFDPNFNSSYILIIDTEFDDEGYGRTEVYNHNTAQEAFDHVEQRKIHNVEVNIQPKVSHEPQ